MACYERAHESLIGAFAGALSYSELGINYPSSGGEYVYLTHAFGPTWGFMTGWVSFFAGFPGAVRYAAIVLGLVVLQVALGVFGHESAYIGLLHGVNALVLFAGAMHTGRVAGKADVLSADESTPAAI